MGYTLEQRIGFLVVVVGFAIFVSGVVLFASSYLIEDMLKGLLVVGGGDMGKNHCEYWAALPTILTGMVLVASIFSKYFFKRHQEFLKYISVCCTFIVMVLALGVIVEESTENARSHWRADNYCEKLDENTTRGYDEKQRRAQCKIFKKADKWFYVMLFSAAITLVLAIVVLFALFADWMLFTAMKSLKNGENSLEMGERYQQFPASQSQGETQMWEGESDDKLQLTPPV